MYAVAFADRVHGEHVTGPTLEGDMRVSLQRNEKDTHINIRVMGQNPTAVAKYADDADHRRTR